MVRKRLAPTTRKPATGRVLAEQHQQAVAAHQARIAQINEQVKERLVVVDERMAELESEDFVLRSLRAELS